MCYQIFMCVPDMPEDFHLQYQSFRCVSSPLYVLPVVWMCQQLFVCVINLPEVLANLHMCSRYANSSLCVLPVFHMCLQPFNVTSLPDMSAALHVCSRCVSSLLSVASFPDVLAALHVFYYSSRCVSHPSCVLPDFQICQQPFLYVPSLPDVLAVFPVRYQFSRCVSSSSSTLPVFQIMCLTSLPGAWVSQHIARFVSRFFCLLVDRQGCQTLTRCVGSHLSPVVNMCQQLFMCFTSLPDVLANLYVCYQSSRCVCQQFFFIYWQIARCVSLSPGVLSSMSNVTAQYKVCQQTSRCALDNSLGCVVYASKWSKFLNSIKQKILHKQLGQFNN